MKPAFSRFSTAAFSLLFFFLFVGSLPSVASAKKTSLRGSRVHKSHPHKVVSGRQSRSNHFAPAAFRVPTFYGGSLVNAPYSRALNVSRLQTRGCADYLAEMGGESRWPEGKCIRVYVAPGRSTFPGMVANCFNQWAAATGHRFTWCFTRDPRSADYCIGWTTHTQCLASGDEAGLTTTDTAVDEGSNIEVIDKARTRVVTRYAGKPLPDCEIAKTVLHEVGHGLGLEGHSPNPRDIMYYAVSDKQSTKISYRDFNTMARLYSH